MWKMVILMMTLDKTLSSYMCSSKTPLELSGRSSFQRQMMHFIDISSVAYVFL